MYVLYQLLKRNHMVYKNLYNQHHPYTNVHNYQVAIVSFHVVVDW